MLYLVTDPFPNEPELLDLIEIVSESVDIDHAVAQANKCFQGNWSAIELDQLLRENGSPGIEALISWSKQVDAHA